MSDEGVKEHELYEQRLKSAERWRELGGNPYRNGFKPGALAGDIQAKFEKATAEELAAAPLTFSVAGRVVAYRSFGKAGFMSVQDRSGSIQLHVKKDLLEARYEFAKEIDLGDFVGAEGTLFRSKTGELTLSVTKFEPLTKSLRPPGAKFEGHAMADTEQRYRQRYLDLLANPKVKETFVKRTKLVQFIRQYLDARGYLEVETPMLHPLVSGAAARPFTTHHNALDLDLFMRIAPELYLKRLVVGGFERVYEINRSFRNEGISTRHNPEFTMLEFYEAYATYDDLMDLTEDLISQAAVAVTGSSTVVYGEHTLEFAKGFRRLSMVDAICEQVKELSPAAFSDPEALRPFALKGTPGAEAAAVRTMNAGELTGFLFEKYVEQTLIQPTFITQFPLALSPLARKNDLHPELTDRFELFVAGREIANAFSELNDPIDQCERFKAQVAAKGRGQEETMDFDHDYIRALEHGMPPTAGEGIGIDRLAMLLTNAQSIRDVILFPLLKPVATPGAPGTPT